MSGENFKCLAKGEEEIEQNVRQRNSILCLNVKNVLRTCSFSQNVRRGAHGSLVKMSGEAQNHFSYPGLTCWLAGVTRSVMASVLGDCKPLLKDSIKNYVRAPTVCLWRLPVGGPHSSCLGPGIF